MRFTNRASPKSAARRLAAVLAWLMLAEASLAGTVTVRTGEHEGFTRLVLDLPRPTRFKIATEGRKTRITLSGPRAMFDTSDSYRRLTTTRLLGIEPLEGESGLALSLGCACSVTAHWLGKAMLVIDIAGIPDASLPASNTVNAAQGEKAALAKPASVRAGASSKHLPELIARTDSTLHLGFGLDLPPAPRASATGPIHAPVPPAQVSPEIDRAALISEAERRLAEQLGRAVAQGLVTPHAPGLPETRRLPHTATPEGISEEGAEHPRLQDKDQPTSPGLNLNAETSADRDFTELLDSLKTTRPGDRCLEDRDLDIPAWGSDASFGAQIGPLRAGLVGEFDRPNQEAERALARVYIHFGFGAEALQVLRNSKIARADRALLTQLGEIMEYGHARVPGPFSGQHDCDGAAALWATMADDPIPSGTVTDDKAILRTLNALPPHLRHHVGAGLSGRLLAYGKHDLAERVLHIVERSESGLTPATTLARAEVDLAGGKHEDATAAFSSVVEGNVDLSPEALIRLIDTQLAAGTRVDHQTAGLAGAYAQEYRKAPVGPELKRVYILALANAGNYDDAFSEMADFSHSAAPETLRPIRSRAMEMLAQGAGEMPFLKHALAPAGVDRADIDSRAAYAVAERLLALGFPVEAGSYLRQPSEYPATERTRLLRARAALELLKPHRAEAHLLGLGSDEADTLRAHARSMDGDHETAGRILARLKDRPGTEREAWLAADWATLTSARDPVLAEAARMAAGRTNADTGGADLARPETMGTLARDRALLDESADTRSTIEALLDRLEAPQDP